MAEKLEFKNDIDVISVLRTRLLGYTTAPDGTTLLNAGNLTIKEVGEAILQDSGLREQIAQIIGVHADDVEKIQEAIETLQGIDTDYGQRVADLEEGHATLNSSLTEVSSLASNTEGRLENVESAVDFVLNDKAVVSGNRVGIPSAEDLAPNGVVKLIEGYSGSYSEVDLGTVSWTYTNYYWYGDIPSKKAGPNATSENYSRIDTWAGFNTTPKVGTFYCNETNERIYVYNGSTTATPTGWLRYDGTANTIRHATIEGYSSRGANLWDEETEAGGLNSNGGNSSESDKIRSKNYIDVEPSKKYYFVSPNGCFMCLYDSSKAFVRGVYIGSGTDSVTTDSNVRYIRFRCPALYGTVYNHDIAIRTTEGGYEPYQSSSVTFSEPIELKKGDVLEPMSGRVTERYKEVDLGSLSWTKLANGWYRTSIADIRKSTSVNELCDWLISDKFKADTYGNVYNKATDGIMAVANDTTLLNVYSSAIASASDITGTLLYELSEPTTRDISPLPSTLPVFKGGEVSLVGNGLGFMSIEVTKKEGSLQTRVKALEDKAEELNEAKKRITNLEYENRIVSAVIRKKIAEETEMTGNVIDFPTAGGYPLAEWGLLKGIEGKSLVWNQLVYASAISNRSTTSPFTIGSGKIPANHVIFAHANMKSDGVCYLSLWGSTPLKLQPSDSFAVWEGCIKRETATDLYVQREGGTYVEWQNAFCTDMTVLFGVTAPSDVTEAMKTFVRTYAEAHPEYDAGSLVSAVYERGVSRGRNLYSGVGNTLDYYISINGDKVSLDNWMYTDFIRVEPNRMVRVRGICGSQRSSVRLFSYGFNKEFVGQVGYSSIQTIGAEYTIEGTVPSNAYYVVLSLRIADTDVMVYQSDNASEYIPYMEPSTLSLSFLNSVEDIGIEGTVVDFEREEVRWSHKKVVFNGNGDGAKVGSNANWNDPYGSANSSGISLYHMTNCDNKSMTSPINDLGDSFNNRNNTYTTEGVGTNGSGNVLFITVKKNTIDQYGGFTQWLSAHPVTVVYELAEPLTKTFSSLGIVIPDSWDGGKPWIRVEAGGTFTVVSSGTPADATVSFLTNLGGN